MELMRMMNAIWTAILFSYCLVLNAQNCDTINGRIINCVDSNGLKQGYWEFYDRTVISSSYSCFGPEGRCVYTENVSEAIESEGFFENDQKIGEWKYYQNNNFGYDHKRKITYGQDGSVTDDRRHELGIWNILKYNNDSTEVNGYALQIRDTVFVNCVSDTCSFCLSNHNELVRFSFDSLQKLQDQLFKLMIGVYDRDIWEKKQSNFNVGDQDNW